MSESHATRIQSYVCVEEQFQVLVNLRAKLAVDMFTQQYPCTVWSGQVKLCVCSVTTTPAKLENLLD